MVVWASKRALGVPMLAWVAFDMSIVLSCIQQHHLLAAGTSVLLGLVIHQCICCQSNCIWETVALSDPSPPDFSALSNALFAADLLVFQCLTCVC